MLPNGFQPRACLYCGSRHLMNKKVNEIFQVSCFFCGAAGPVAQSSDEAWLSWNGECAKAPSMFGSQGEVFVQ